MVIFLRNRSFVSITEKRSNSLAKAGIAVILLFIECIIILLMAFLFLFDPIYLEETL